jgi:vitamin B12 transporter
MRKKITLIVFSAMSFAAMSQDSLKTTTLKEVVVTGTKFDVPIEKSGKTIFKISRESIERNAGKSLADLLNEVPGIQSDGNFSTPGSNISYYLRGGRNKNTLILIDGVPLNDPSAINAEYDLRYIPVSQIESVEVLKGGLSTLYGTGAAAGVINIKLKSPEKGKISGDVEASAGSFGTYSENASLRGGGKKLSFLVMGNNTSSKGFSSAQDNDPAVVFDKDGFNRQNAMLKLDYRMTPRFSIGGQTAYEKFKADFDAYEFTDAANSQTYDQIRIGVTPKLNFEKGSLEGKFFFNSNQRDFKSSYPSTLNGKNTQAEIIHRHSFSEKIQTVAGVNLQHMAFDQKSEFDNAKGDTTNFTMIDPYASIFVDLPQGLNIHAGLRLNTHSVYGSQLVYNLNPSFLFNKDGKVRYKVIASVATSYITPSLYQLYSAYGNTELNPEKSINYESGFSIITDALTFNAVWFERQETDPIDFVSIFDASGKYLRGEYQNLVSERKVYGLEFNVDYKLNDKFSLAANYTSTDTDKPKSFYKIPKTKYGMSLNATPFANALVTVKYNFTGDRTTFDFSKFSEVELKHYSLVDVFASYGLMRNALTVYGGVNNLLDEKFIAQYGYTTRGRNFSAGIRYKF